MTTENTMSNLETWVRQLNGELIVSQVANVRAKLPETIKNCSIFLRSNGTVGILASTNIRRQRPCNVEFIFDGDTNQLIDVRMINQDDNDD